MYYKLFSSVCIVRGFNRAIIYDLQRNKYSLIPLSLYSFIKKINGKNFDEIAKATKNINLVKHNIDFLAYHEYIFLCESKAELKRFPKINLNFDFPAHISNLVIEDPKLETIKSINIIIDKLNIPYVQFIFSRPTNYKKLDEILSFIKNTCFRSIEIIMPKQKSSIQDFDKLIKRHIRISFVLLYNSDKNYIHPRTNNGIQQLIETKKDITNRCIQDESLFVCNISVYTEAQKYHAYFNKKMHINYNGEIKNSHNSTITFGNINNQETVNNILDLINSRSFQEFWGVTKDKCDICKFCEYRYMCLDDRIPSQRNKSEWYHSQECNYNPFISKWRTQKEYLSLKEIGVISNNKKFIFNRKIINLVNKQLWNEKKTNINST